MSHRVILKLVSTRVGSGRFCIRDTSARSQSQPPHICKMSASASGNGSERPAKIRKLGLSSDVATKDNGVIGSIYSPRPDASAETPVNHGQGDELAMSNGEKAFHVSEGDVAPKLSKNQLKKLRKREQWEAGRADRKIMRKEKIKAKKERKREERQANEAAGIPTDIKPRKAVQLPITFILDCSWDELMMEKEVISLGNQLTRSYSDNFKANFRAHLAVSSFGGRLKERFDTILERQYEGWKGFHFLEKDFVETADVAEAWMAPRGLRNCLQGEFSKFEGQEEILRSEGEVVYLSSDSDETLTELKPYSVYIIGGLVDKNRHKGICHKRAGEKGVKTAKLPIGDYMSMNSRYVLAVNHVSEIMLKWLEFGDWAKAFEEVMPKRKGGILKELQCEASNDGHEAPGGDEDDNLEREHSISRAPVEAQECPKPVGGQVEAQDISST